MYKVEAVEAASICNYVLGLLLRIAPTRGRPGSDLRTAVGDFLANANALLYSDQAGPPLDEIFTLARKTGLDVGVMTQVADAAAAQTPTTVGATIVANVLTELALATECEIIANMVFVSREDVTAIRDKLNVQFSAMEEIAADDMAQANYQALIALHAALSFHLTETARPLPRLLNYRFFAPLPSLVVAYKLYADAGRADELRDENKNIHPAFMQMFGRALSN